MGRVQSLRIGVSAQMLPIIFGYGSNLLATPFIVSQLGLHDFGLWALTGALAQFGVLLDLGVTRSINRFVALYHARGERHNERAVVGGSLMIITALSLILLCVPLLIPGILSDAIHADSPELARTLFLCSVAIMATGLLGAILGSASFGRGRMVAGNVGVTIQRSAVVIGGVIALIIEPTLEWFAVGSVIGGIVGLAAIVIAIWIDEREIVIGMPSRAVMPDLLSFGLKGQMMGVFEIVLFQSGKIIAGAVIGPAAAGAYELGSRLALGARAVGTTASVALTTHLTRQFATGGADAVRGDYVALTRKNTAVSIYVLFLLAATTASAVPLWLGNYDHDISVIIALLAIGFAVNVSTGVATASSLALDRVGIALVGGAFTSVLAIAAAIPLAMGFGIIGLSVAFIAAFVLGSALFVYLLQRVADIPAGDFINGVSGPFVVAFMSLAVSTPIGFAFSPQDRAAAIVPFILGAGVFTAIYLTLGWRFGCLPKAPKLPFFGRAKKTADTEHDLESLSQPVE